VRLSLANGSITELNGHSASNIGSGHSIALSCDGSMLYVGYWIARCVAAYDVATLQLMWEAEFETDVLSVAYIDGVLFVTAEDGPVTVLSAEDGSLERTLGVVDGAAWGVSVFAGLAAS
jgi:hypothetical protein